MRDITVGGRIYWDFHTQPSAEFRQNGAKTKPSRGQQFCRQKCLVDEKGQRRFAKAVSR